MIRQVISSLSIEGFTTKIRMTITSKIGGFFSFCLILVIILNQDLVFFSRCCTAYTFELSTGLLSFFLELDDEYLLRSPQASCARVLALISAFTIDIKYFNQLELIAQAVIVEQCQTLNVVR